MTASQNPNSLFATFDMDTELERTGVEANYGNVRFRIARAGGGNEAFGRVFKALSKKYQHQMENDLMTDEQSTDLLAEVYALAVVLSCDVLVNGEWVKDVLPKEDGTTEPFTKAGCKKLLIRLPELFRDIQNRSKNLAAFKKQQEALIEGN